MSSHLCLTITCPHCGAQNSITTTDLPVGSLLGCSHCRSDLATWRGSSAGFEPIQMRALLHSVGGMRVADVEVAA